MDQIDKNIVGLLQSNAKISMKDLGKAVHLSSPSVTEQVWKLEEQQIIEGYHAHVSLKS
ncbi:AsnC-type helix-turn-helix domain-containing protein [Lysinibacillus sp. AC-3]|nr:AsnC-type helix-turn-helix domain-containing protein [Lysinibacillus sp. AC-3]